MKSGKIFLLCSAIALFFSSSVNAGQSLDQGYTPTLASGPMIASAPYRQSPTILGQAQTLPWLAQTFEVGLSGQLTGVDLLLSKRDVAHDSSFGPLTISLFSVNSGMPSTQWAATTIQSSVVGYAPNDGAWLNIDFSMQNLSVAAGDKLAIVVHRPDTGTAYDNDTFYGWSLPIWWYGGTLGDYLNGDAFMNSDSGSWNKLTGYADPTLQGSDFGFRTYVAAVPEPETYAIMMAGLGLLGFMVWRKKQA